MTLLTRDAILKAEDLQTEEVDVPEWGGKVRVRSLTGSERDAFEAACVDAKGQMKDAAEAFANLRARLVALTVVDEEGARMFGLPDVGALGAKNARALNRVFEVAQKLSGLSKDDVKELTEGFPEGQSVGSTSA